MSLVFFVLMLIAMLGVAASLIAGVVLMAKGGEGNKKYSNRLMQIRVWMQGLALIFFILGFLTAPDALKKAGRPPQ